MPALAAYDYQDLAGADMVESKATLGRIDVTGPEQHDPFQFVEQKFAYGAPVPLVAPNQIAGGRELYGVRLGRNRIWCR